MKKLLGILVLSLLFSGNVFADSHIISIQCKSDDPGLAIFKPIYIINLKTKKVKVGAGKKYLIKFTEDEIVIGDSSAGMSDKMKINRFSGRYEKELIFYGKTEEEKSVINTTGIWVRKKQVF